MHALHEVSGSVKAVVIPENPEYISAQQAGELMAVFLLTHNEVMFRHQANHGLLGNDFGVNNSPVVIEQNMLYLAQSFGNSSSPLRP